MGKRTKQHAQAGRPPDVQKHEAMLDAARDLFFAHGVGPVSIDAVAKTAKVSRMTVYGHFGDKEGLFREVILRQAGAVAEALEATGAGPGRKWTDLREELTAFGTTLLGFLSRPEVKAWNKLRTEEAPRYPQFAEVFQQAGPGAVLKQLAGRLRAANRTGAVATPDVQVAARHLVALLLSGNVGRPVAELEAASAAATVKHVTQSVDAFLRAYAPVDK